MKLLSFFFHLIMFVFLTIATQVGGLIWLFSFIISKKVKIKKAFLSTFVVFYLVSTFVLVPIIAPLFGRVALPIFSNDNIKPAHYYTVLWNRHYVSKQMYDSLLEITASKDVGPVLYLDANFPFIDGFPLIPHLSHSDGKKIDLAFGYKSKEGAILSSVPSPIGYGISELPRDNEEDMPYKCAKNGYKIYNVMYHFFKNNDRSNYVFDEKRTKKLLERIVKNKNVKKIFLEPHLKNRLRLNSSKIRFQGCHSVRHDDHIHVQL